MANSKRVNAAEVFDAAVDESAVQSNAEVTEANENRTPAPKVREKTREELIAEEIARNEEYVEVDLFRDNAKYKDEVNVAVGNENCVIKRGMKVRVKRKFALAIEESLREDFRVAEVIRRETERADF